MLPLVTCRLTIRRFVAAADWEPLHAMILKYQASPYAVYDHKWPTSPEEIRKVAEWFAGGETYLAACLKDSGRFVGFIALNADRAEPAPSLNLGYVFDEEFHGRGYAAEACRAAIARAFEDLGAAQMVSGTHPANTPSVRLLKRLGFGNPDPARPDFYVLSKAAWAGRQT